MDTPPDYVSPEYATALTREVEPILAELGIDAGTAHRLFLERVVQHDPEVLSWLRAAAAHDAWCRSKEQKASDRSRPLMSHRQVMDEAQPPIGDIKAEQSYLDSEAQKWLEAPPVGREVLPEDLTTEEAIASYLAEAENRGEPDYSAHAQEIAELAKRNLKK
nr:hypothetical protein [uncultured Halomonas sp.]